MKPGKCWQILHLKVIWSLINQITFKNHQPDNKDTTLSFVASSQSVINHFSDQTMPQSPDELQTIIRSRQLSLSKYSTCKQHKPNQFPFTREKLLFPSYMKLSFLWMYLFAVDNKLTLPLTSKCTGTSIKRSDKSNLYRKTNTHTKEKKVLFPSYMQFSYLWIY